jgi:hypothetical protein
MGDESARRTGGEESGGESKARCQADSLAAAAMVRGGESVRGLVVGAKQSMGHRVARRAGLGSPIGTGLAWRRVGRRGRGFCMGLRGRAGRPEGRFVDL